MARVEDMLHKMMRRFGASDEHIKKLRCDLASIGQKVYTHAISIKQIELQMAQLSATVNTRQPGTLRSNTFQNPKNDVYGWGFGPCRQFFIALSSGQAKVQMDLPLLDYPSISSWSS